MSFALSAGVTGLQAHQKMLDVAGNNLANVNTISLGFGDKSNPVAGGSGMVFFDDIRLYRTEP